MNHRRRGRRALIAFVLFGLLAAAPAAAAPAAGLPGPGEASQLIVALRPDADGDARQPAQLGALSAIAGVRLAYARPMSGGAHVLRLPAPLPAAQARQIAARLGASADVLFAEPDYINRALATPNDPLFDQQWDFGPASAWGAGLEDAWEYTTGDPNLAIAVLDTGIRPEHPDIAGRSVAGLGYDFVSLAEIASDGGGRDADPSDPGDWSNPGECGSNDFGGPSSWHGTHVAGTIAAAGGNNTGVAGINWRSKLLNLRVLGKCGGLTSDVADAIRWAAGIAVPGVPANAHPARVINMSLGGSALSCPQTYQRAIDDAVARGVVVVVAAGNEDAPANQATPANCNNVIAVGATTRQGVRASYSNYGPQVDLSAPGGEQVFQDDPDGILSTLNDGPTGPGASSYGFYQGTSMAAPHVAGVASLMLSLDPTLTPAQVESLLKANVTSFPSGCSAGSGNCGAGILNAAKVLKALEAPPTIADTAPPNGLQGTPYAFRFVAGGAPAPTFDVQSGELPDGLALDSSGLLKGWAPAAGAWQFTLRASNGVGTPATKTVKITIEKRELFYAPIALLQR